MLIITRRPNERVCFTLPDGEQVWITLTGIDRNQVRLGIDAPREIVINREELLPENLRYGA